MMRMRWMTASLILLALVACRKESPEPANDAQTTMPMHTGTTASSTAAPAAAPYDLQFLDTMSKHHQAAVQMATMAQSKVQLPELKKMTKDIPQDQQKEIDQMKAWRDQWYPGAPPADNMQMPGMSASMNMDMGHLESMKPGKSYDAMFLNMMIPHHEGAVQMSQEALRKAEHAEVKTLAQQIIDKQQNEIEQMKQWKTKLTK